MLFIDKNSNIDKDAMRLYVMAKLMTFRDEFNVLLKNHDHSAFWESLHNKIVSLPDDSEKNSYLKVESQILRLGDFIDTWIHTAVDSPERLEFFVQVKATEIRSGDAHHDYFWALQIRHDQLVAMVKVLETLREVISKWVNMPPEKVINSGVFQGLTEYSVEDQMYLEAENIQRQREKVSK
jgi:hypothetical protein